MRTAFVAGATGYTGREVVRLLAEAGHRAVAHVRPDSSRREEWTERFEAMGAEVDVTAWDEEAMTKTLAALRPDAVFSLLGTTRTRAKSEGRSAVQGYEAIDYGLSALLRRACVASGSAPRFVYLSSLGVTPNTTNPYMRARARIEKELADGELPYTVVRPAYITGADRDDDRLGERVQAATLQSIGAFLGVFGAKRMRQRLATTTNTALAGELVRLSFDPAADRQIVESEDLAKR